MISIGLPAYKSKYLKNAIQSVLNQTYKDFELIIVNDNSPENIEEIINEFNDKRIRYYKNEINFGKDSVVKSWNICLSYALGNYFVLFSDDDIYQEKFLEQLMILALKYPDVDLFHSRVMQIDSYNCILRISSSLPEYEDQLDFIINRFSGCRIQFAPDFMCKLSKLKSLGGFYDLPLAWGSDDITWFLLAKNGVVASNEILCSWRLSHLNISAIGNINKRLEAVNKYENWYLNEKVSLYNCYKDDCRLLYLSKLEYYWFENQRGSLLNAHFKKKKFLSFIKLLLTNNKLKRSQIIKAFIKS
jgi:glycosyltransferase involved in cell wall biosynthesis